jgi:chorismate lyase/3-hydroxybenzoate synthase
MPSSSGPPTCQHDSSSPLASHAAWFERAPAWVRQLSERAGEPTIVVDDAHPVTVIRNAGLSFVVGGVRGIHAISERELEKAAASLYSSVLSTLRRADRHPWRFWNFIPGLLKPMNQGLNRYMVFNAGRALGYRGVFPPGALPQAIATASGVGTWGHDLLVGCLAGTTPGVAIENPRQVPAHRYSTKFGPSAPFFVRATLVGARLLIGGTAAIAGEECIAPGDLDAQVDETVRNLDALVAAGAERRHVSLEGPPLGRLTSLRVYVVDRRASARVEARLAALGIRCPIELVEAVLCRPELLVEIEGTADLGAW